MAWRRAARLIRSRESPREFWRRVANKYRAGVDVLPEDVFTAIAAILNAAGSEGLGAVTIQVVALDQEHLGLYGRWRVRLLEDGGSRPEMHEEVVKSWYGEVRVGISHRKTGPAEYELTARVRLACGPDELGRAMFFASRALFLAALREDPNSGVI